MPLGMQIVGRPFADSMVLKVAYAYEQATMWHQRQPILVPGDSPAVIDHTTHDKASPQIAPELRQLVGMLAARAGLSLPEPLLLQLCEAAPYAFAMAQRLPVLKWEAEPANVFRFPGPWYRLPVQNTASRPG